jgi:hypothetical protein
MAFVLADMHRDGAALDYPVSCMGSIVDALVAGDQQGSSGSKVHLRQTVASIDMDSDSNGDGKRVKGITLTTGKVIRARDGVICNAPVWSLKHLIKDERMLQIMNGDGKPAAVPSKSNDTRASQSSSSWNVTEEGSSIQPVRRAPPIPNDSDSQD